MEYMPMGSLHTLIHDTPWLLTPFSLLSILLSITRGMIYLHSHKPYPILHRDLSSRNILIAGSISDLVVKIADFGLSEEIRPEEQGLKTGQVWIKPPEVMKGERWTEKGDVWSFGCVMYEGMTGKEVWKDLEELEGIEGEEKGRKWERLVKEKGMGWRGKEVGGFGAGGGKELGEILEGCWEYEKEERKEFRELLGMFERVNSGYSISSIVKDHLANVNGSLAGNYFHSLNNNNGGNNNMNGHNSMMVMNGNNPIIYEDDNNESHNNNNNNVEYGHSDNSGNYNYI
eukprot:TRINITY_DN1177_c1_g1_i1.p1 TRINITY_DN1177_c1_g1~~TRINITY_DN1177_c1_g1_i1.p1  ORF type:complete len:286 (+),score=101.86 TRINITY_DN1177_c1_g1_i1:122-979(+)